MTTLHAGHSQRSLCILTTSYPSFVRDSKRLPKGKFVHHAAKSFVSAGFAVHVVTHAEPGTALFAKVDGVNIHRFHYFVSGWETLTSGAGIPENIRHPWCLLQVPFYFFRLFWTAYRIVQENRIRYINAHWAFPPGFIGYLIKRMTGRTLIITAYGAEIFPLDSGRWTFLKPFVRMSARGADLLVAISKNTADALERVAPGIRPKIIPDGIDTAYYSPGPPNLTLLERYKIFGRKVLFFTGRMVERKGHRYLLEAMPAVKKEHPDACLLLGGDGPLQNELEALKRRLCLENDVIMPGPIPEEEIVDWMRSADLFVLPSCIDSRGDTEGSATIALEAMACGTIALVSEVGGNIGAVQEGEGAYYFPPADVEALAGKINEILSFDTDHAIEQQRRATLFVRNHYSWEKIVGKYLAFLSAETADGFSE
ncbi:MAG: glycosyltransferase family 4 protein [Candidatus Hydrogenedentota bacterium]|nr:MAG: glycosyltransferase family 4 protein [Candidatus Hydrogenedentota bacterium]